LPAATSASVLFTSPFASTGFGSANADIPLEANPNGDAGFASPSFAPVGFAKPAKPPPLPPAGADAKDDALELANAENADPLGLGGVARGLAVAFAVAAPKADCPKAEPEAGAPEPKLDLPKADWPKADWPKAEEGEEKALAAAEVEAAVVVGAGAAKENADGGLVATGAAKLKAGAVVTAGDDRAGAKLVAKALGTAFEVDDAGAPRPKPPKPRSEPLLDPDGSASSGSASRARGLFPLVPGMSSSSSSSSRPGALALNEGLCGDIRGLVRLSRESLATHADETIGWGSGVEEAEPPKPKPADGLLAKPPNALPVVLAAVAAAGLNWPKPRVALCPKAGALAGDAPATAKLDWPNAEVGADVAGTEVALVEVTKAEVLVGGAKAEVLVEGAKAENAFPLDVDAGAPKAEGVLAGAAAKARGVDVLAGAPKAGFAVVAKPPKPLAPNPANAPAVGLLGDATGVVDAFAPGPTDVLPNPAAPNAGAPKAEEPKEGAPRPEEVEVGIRVAPKVEEPKTGGAVGVVVAKAPKAEVDLPTGVTGDESAGVDISIVSAASAVVVAFSMPGKGWPESMRTRQATRTPWLL
jgi:hypothetical protein